MKLEIEKLTKEVVNETALAHLRSRNALDDCHQIFMQYGNTARFSIYTESKQFFCHVL
jgi:hypothetical protein